MDSKCRIDLDLELSSGPKGGDEAGFGVQSTFCGKPRGCRLSSPPMFLEAVVLWQLLLLFLCSAPSC